MIYVIGSLKNPEVPKVAANLRVAGYEVFDDWYSAGPDADAKWQEHQEFNGRSYKDALYGPAATHVFAFDKRYLDAADAAVLVLPAGKSGHLELGYVIGRGKPGFIYMPQEPEKWDVMYRFATGIARDEMELRASLAGAGVV